MRTYERLSKMRDFFYTELCMGREFKAPVPSPAQSYGPVITDFTTAEPQVFIGWQPMRPNALGRVFAEDPWSVCPSITIMPGPSPARYVEEKRFDRYKGIHRTQDMGQSLCVTILFSIYEPGVRLPGLVEAMERGERDAWDFIEDGTESGVKTLTNWMDDAVELILRERNVPGTDLTLEDDNMVYSFYTDQNFIVDKRPLYYGYINVEWKGFASTGNDHGKPSKAQRLLDGID